MATPHAESETVVPVLGTHGEALAAAAAFAAAVAPDAARRDREGTVPRAELAALDGSGLLGITVPAEDGGPGLPPVTLAEVIRRIAAADPALAQVPQGHYLLVDVVAMLGTPDQRAAVMGPVLAGTRISASLAERGGRHAQDLVTRIAGPPGARRVSGRKFYCTGALTARWVAVNALDEDGDLVIALLDRDAPGLTLDEDWTAMGQRATVSGSAVIEDVPVPELLVLPYGRAFEGPQLLGARAQLVHAAIEVGIARGALDDATAFLSSRARPFFEAARAGVAERAVDDPHTLARLGRLTARVTAAEQLLRWAGEQLGPLGVAPSDPDAAARGSIAVAQAKAFGSEVAVEVASELFTLCGASATDARWSLDRHWRNARTHSVHDPVAWKYHHVGAWAAEGRRPPNHGQL